MNKARPNDRLAQVMRDAGLSNKAFARAIRGASADHERPVSCDHTSVSRWLGGTAPRRETALVMVAVLSERLGRPISLADIGLGHLERVDPSLGTDYPGTVDDATGSLARLWRADIDDDRAVTEFAPHAGASATASLSWLVRAGPDRLAARVTGARVGAADVAAVRATVNAFAALDNQYGGGHAHRAFVQYLESHVTGLLRGRYTEPTGRQLYSAAAEGTLLAAWSSYDAGRHGLAQRYFIQALRLAQAADDVLLAGSVLDAMSHQATFLRHPAEAATLARAARAGTRDRATATLTAHFWAMEARALAASGDATGTQRALGEAARFFERRQLGADPPWIAYVDEAELAAEFCHSFRDIGRGVDAVTYAQQALSGASARSDFFVTMVLASGYLLQAKPQVEEACRVAQAALDLGAQLKSARCLEYLRSFRQQLATYAKLPEVQALDRFAAEHPLWLASGV